MPAMKTQRKLINGHVSVTKKPVNLKNSDLPLFEKVFSINIPEVSVLKLAKANILKGSLFTFFPLSSMIVLSI